MPASGASPRETILVIATDAIEVPDFASFDRLGSNEVVIASAAVFPAQLRAELEARGFRVVEVPGGTFEALCEAGMATATGHVVRVRELRALTAGRALARQVGLTSP